MSQLTDVIRATLISRRDVRQGLEAAAKVSAQKLDALELFRPTAYQEKVILELATENQIKGGVRSGKSVCVAAMVSSYLRNKPITFADGSKHDMREVGWMKKAVVVWLVGLQLNHIGQTLHRLLCRAGAFDMVRDKKTNLWRAWQPGRFPEDLHVPQEERFPAPPFIPAHEIVEETWENKKEFKFTSLQLKDGSICYGFASTGDVKRGDPVNLIWIDEEIANSEHYAEWQSRLSDRKGRIIWSSWPDMKTPAMQALHRRCIDQADEVLRGVRKKADCIQFTFRMRDSPFLDDEEKRKRSEGWTEEESRARDLGEFVTDTIVAYPEFNRKFHCVDYGPNSPLNDKVTEAMRRLNWNVPSDWCVDLILDPGTSNPALLWAAIPPRSFWDEDQPYYIIFREMAVPRIDASDMARRARFADPGRQYMRFIGDSKAGEQTPMGFSWAVFEQYSREFRKEGLRCQLTNDMFLRGETTWVVRSMKLKAWMRGRSSCGRPQFRVVTHACPVLVRQLEETVKGVAKDAVLDKLAPGQKHDVLDTAEYYAGFDPVFIMPPPATPLTDPGFEQFNRDKKMLEAMFAKGKSKDSDRKIVLGIP